MRIITLLSITALLLIPLFGQTQNALHFDGINDYVQTAYSGIQGNSNRTVEAWINTPYVAGQEVIVDWGTVGTGQRFTFNLINGLLRVEVLGSGFTTTTLVGDNTWHHVAVTYNDTLPTKYKMYIDGVLDTEFNISTPVNTGTSTNVRIGARIDNDKLFSGKIDEVRIWNGERTASEILTNMNTEFCSPPNNLVAWYKFNQGVASGNNTGITTLYDFSGSLNNGTLNSFALSGSTSNWVSGVSHTMNTAGTSTITAATCSDYTSPSGNYIWNTTGIYQDTIPNAAGCDSIITVDLTIYTSSTSNLIISSCDYYISPSGGYYWASTGIYQDTLTNANGCDSIITVDLTISSNSTSSLTLSSCADYVSPSGNYVWTSTGIYQDTIPNVGGCDSIITIDFTIKSVDTAVTVSGAKLTASSICDSYQWLDCDNNFSVITDATNQTYTAIVEGNYAVELSQDGCIDTSLCYNITNIGMDELNNSTVFSIYPNPNDGSFIIKTDLVEDNIQMEVFNIEGKLIISRTLVGSEIRGKTISLSDLNNGMYYIKMHFSDKTYTQKLVIQN